MGRGSRGTGAVRHKRPGPVRRGHEKRLKVVTPANDKDETHFVNHGRPDRLKVVSIISL